MRVTAAVAAVVALAIVGRFFIDDVVGASDVPRGVVVAGVAIGNTDRDEAAERLAAVSPEGTATLTFAGESRTRPLGEWGVVLDIDATLDDAEAARGGGLIRFLRWAAAVLRDRHVDPVWTVDRDVLAAQFDGAAGEPDELDIAVETSTIELVDGVFRPVERRTVPLVDVDGLVSALLDAVEAGGDITIEVPSAGEREILGDSALATAANAMTGTELAVVMAGELQPVTFGPETLREWLDVAGADATGDFRFDPDKVTASLTEAFPRVGDPEAPGVEFVIGFDGKPWVVGGIPEARCCAPDTAERLFDHLLVGPDEPIVVFPEEPEGARGVNWAYSLGITEVIGEFTTYYKPNQTRNINIARIAELTRGVIIEPGETFSVNDFVGPRTTEKGFVAAGVISNGVFSTSVGGGISQYATTLFNAAFFAGLDFGEYQSHSIYIDRYPYGREATVSYPHPDLQIRNTTPYAVLLWPTTDDDSITVRLYATPYVVGEQTGQTTRREGVACTRVITTRTRTWLEDGRTETDTVTARYRPEGVACSGQSTVPTTSTTTTSTTVPTSVP